MYTTDLKKLINMLNQARRLKKKFFFFYFYNKTIYKYLIFFQQYGLLLKWHYISGIHTLNSKDSFVLWKQFQKKKIGIKIFLKYTTQNTCSFKKIFLVSKNKQNIVFTKTNLLLLQQKAFVAQYIFYTNFGLLSYNSIVKKRIGGILLFKII